MPDGHAGKHLAEELALYKLLNQDDGAEVDVPLRYLCSSIRPRVPCRLAGRAGH